MIFEDIEYQIIRSKRKSLSLEVTRNAEVIVRAPLNMPEIIINEFLFKRYEWIKNSIQKQKERENKYNLSADELKCLMEKAVQIIPGRVEYYSKIMHLYPTAVKINFARTRFGSCSSKNSINFSAYLMLFPTTAVDYVVVHELAHIKYKNHQKEFYSLVEKYMPDYKNRAKLLKR